MASTTSESAFDGKALDLHALRRRRSGPDRVPFRDVDTFEGVASDPLTLHKYVYGNDDPVNHIDPSGHYSLSGVLAVGGITALGISILLPSIRGAWNQAYHVSASGATQKLFAATLSGDATLADWKRVFAGLGHGAGAGGINVLDTLSFHLISPLHQYRNQLWRSEGLDQSWIGTTANGFAWVGTGLLYAAGLVYAWSAFGRPTMDIAVRRTGEAFPKFLHFEYGVDGIWQEASGEVGKMWIAETGTGAGAQITEIPVLFPDAVLVEGAPVADAAYNCATAVLRAVFRGWGGW